MADRRLQRDREQGMIGGVCADLAAHFDYDVTLLRVVTVLLTFVGGIGVVAYLALWVLLPEAGGASDSPASVARDNLREIAGLATRAARAGQQAVTRAGDRGDGQRQADASDTDVADDAAAAAGAAGPPPEEPDSGPPAEPGPPDTRPPGQ